MKRRPLDERHKEAARLLGKGNTQSDVAELVGVTRQAVSSWMRRPDFRELVERAKLQRGKGAPVVQLVTDSGQGVELPPNWRRLSSTQLALAALPAVGIITAAMRGANVTRHQLDTARWLVERLAIEAPEEIAPDEITTSEDLIAALAESVDPRVLMAALERAAV